MAKTKTKTVINENFKSLELLIDTMEERKENKVFTNRDLSSQRIDENEWHGTRTYKESMEIIKAGYIDPLDKMKKAILKIGENENHKRPTMKNDVMGYVPHVPNMLMGLPQTMINKERVPKKNKMIHLTYSFCVDMSVKTEQMIQGGITFISLVNSLEKQGYRVKIDAIFTSITSKTISSVVVNLKEYGQKLNLLKLAFPLVHPAMLRRIAFKWLETVPNLTDNEYNNGYGRPLGSTMGNRGQDELRILKRNKVIRGENSYYCNAYETMDARNIEELAFTMGLK
jgi:hypothetical protein